MSMVHSARDGAFLANQDIAHVPSKSTGLEDFFTGIQINALVVT
jgi:hypothetical protein